MVSIGEPGAGLLTRCILMAAGDKASIALQRKGTVRVGGGGGPQHLTYASQHCCFKSVLSKL